MAQPSATSIEGNVLPLPSEMAPEISLTPIIDYQTYPSIAAVRKRNGPQRANVSLPD